MGFCICGVSRDEKPEPKAPPAITLTKDPSSKDINENSNTLDDQIELPRRLDSNTNSVNTQLSKPASRRPSVCVNELTHEPEEQYGMQYMITEESIDRQARSARSYRTLTNEHETEEDRWFVAEEKAH